MIRAVVLASLASILAGCAQPVEELPTAGELTLSLFEVEDDPYLGDPEAPIQIVAFEAPACSNCKRFDNDILPGIQADFLDTGKAVLYMQQGSIGYPHDERANVALECAFAQGGNDPYFAFQRELYSGEPYGRGWDEDRLIASLESLAEAYDLDADGLVACYDNQDSLPAVEADLAQARASRTPGVPAFWVFRDGTGTLTSSGGLRDLLS